MTMFRLRPTSVSGFPRCGSISACHALRSIPPSSNPACGFPALGLPENSRSGHSQRVARFERSQGHQPQALKVFVHRSPFRLPKGSLAPPFKMRCQPKFQKAVDFAKCLAWIAIIKVITPACQLSVDLPNHARNRRTAFPPCGQLMQLLPLTIKRFVRRKHVEVSLLPMFIQASVEAEREPQKVKSFSHFSHVHHSGLFTINLQTHPGLHLACSLPFPKIAVTCISTFCFGNSFTMGIL